MLRILTASSILALAAVPALAQPADPMAAPPAPDAPAATEQAPATTQPAPAEPSAAAPAAEPREAQVAKLVDTEFPTYDANKNGDLDQPEFTKWVLALRDAAPDASAKAMDEAAKAKWAKDAFAAADADKSKKVSKAEMNKFLLG
jgi:Ca2+-binding EF-hand superfamily protein